MFLMEFIIFQSLTSISDFLLKVESDHGNWTQIIPSLITGNPFIITSMKRNNF